MERGCADMGLLNKKGLLGICMATAFRVPGMSAWRAGFEYGSFKAFSTSGLAFFSDKKMSGQLIPQVQWVQNPFYRFKSIARLPLDGHQKQGKERKLQENKKEGTS